MFEVRLVKGGRTNVYGTYPERAQADAIAETHRSTGYWERVEVNAK